MVATAIAGASPAGASNAPSTAAPAPHRVSDLQMVQETGKVSPYKALIAHCPPGKQPLGGGFDLPIQHTVAASYPIADTGWLIKARPTTEDASPFEMTAYAMCATPSPGYRIIKKSATVPSGGGVGQTCAIANYPYEYMVNVGGEAKGPSAALTGSDIWMNQSSKITYASARGIQTKADTVEVDVYTICATAYDGSSYWLDQWESSHTNDRGPLWACPAGVSSIGVTFTAGASLRSSKPHTISQSDWRVTALKPEAAGYTISGKIVCGPGPGR
ncbi:hypothetical protein [Actinomadura terrae]|uniref:hypothetical protein n=1 Tax=Actinomadura terrae TaxID=604353 RepID=UPI001FA75FC9|nr:hypothetical protein [Actinomadura terrae]